MQSHRFTFFFFKGTGHHRYLYVVTHSFPTRRSSDLAICVAPHKNNSRSAGNRSTAIHHDRIRILRSEEHTSELQSRNDISYAVFCLKKKKKKHQKRIKKRTELKKNKKK